MDYGRWIAGGDRWRRARQVAIGLGLGLVAATLMVTLGPDRRGAEPLPPPPGPFLPPVSAPAPAPTGPPPRPDLAMTSSPSAPAGTRTAPPSPPTTRPAARPSSTRPADPEVTGRYRVVQSFDDGFIGEVLVRNAGGRDRDWTVRLRFAGNVGALRTSWVESAPQATLTVSGGTFTWASGVAVPAGSDVALRFHFSRSGAGDRPRSCTVNGAACTG